MENFIFKNSGSTVLGAFALGVITSLSYVWFTSQKSNRPGKEYFVVGMCAEYKPFEFKSEKGVIQGFDVDLAREIAQRLGKELVIKDLSFDALILSLKNKEIDAIISAMSVTPDRLKEIDMIAYYGQAVTKLALVFWGAAPQNISSLQDFARTFEQQGRKDKPVIAVQTGTTQANYLAKQTCVTARMLDGVSEILLDIQRPSSQSSSQAALVRHDLAYQLVKEYPHAVTIFDIPLEKEDWVLGDGVGINKDFPELSKNVSRIIDELKEEGFISWLERKWFGSQKTF